MSTERFKTHNSDVTIFLDLENTLIVDWFDPTPINHSKFEKFICKHFFGMNTEDFADGHKVPVTIFSWAIDNQNDIESFNKVIRGIIEREFPIQIENIITRSHALSVAGRFMNRPILDLDDELLLGKERIFFEFCRGSDLQGRVVLFDDTASNLTLMHNSLFKPVQFFETVNPSQFPTV